MENHPSLLQVAQISNPTEYVRQRFETDAPKAATFGIQVSIFVIAVILAITFIKFFFSRSDQ